MSSAITIRTGSPPRAACPPPVGCRSGASRPGPRRGRRGRSTRCRRPPLRRRRRRRRPPAVRAPSTTFASIRHVRRRRMLDSVRDRLARDEVGGRLDLRSEPLVGSPPARRERARHARGRREPRRGLRPAVAAGRPRRSCAGPRSRCPTSSTAESSAGPRIRASRGSESCSRRSMIPSVTSRCCAPSCRSRSSRRRSSYPAWTTRARDSSTSASWSRTSTRRRAISIARLAAARTLRSRSGRSSSDGACRRSAISWPRCSTLVTARPSAGGSPTTPAASA